MSPNSNLSKNSSIFQGKSLHMLYQYQEITSFAILGKPQKERTFLRLPLEITKKKKKQISHYNLNEYLNIKQA